MKKIIMLLSILVLGCKPTENHDSSKVESVSLVSVIANPEKYHKKRVVVEGYFIMESEGDAIYISKEDCLNMIQKNGIFLFTNPKELSEFGLTPPYRGYVRIEGIFNKDIKGSYNFYSGTFEKIFGVDRLLKKGTIDELNMD